MKVLYHKKFDKRFEKLTSKLQDKVIEVIELFQKNPIDPILKNHPLHGRMRGKRAISVMGQLRVSCNVGYWSARAGLWLIGGGDV